VAKTELLLIKKLFIMRREKNIRRRKLSQNNRQDEFASRWGFLAAAIGMAVGTGNIWRFPRMVALYGGGAYILIYTLALFLWSAPLLMSEMAMGRSARLGPIGSFRDFVGRRSTWMGAWMVAVCMLITFYYAVVTGWCMKYTVFAFQGAFKPGVDTQALWDKFLHSPWQNLFYQFLAIFLTGVILYKGIKGGVEKVTKIMVPALFFFLIVAALRGVTLHGANLGLEYIFVPDWSKLKDPATWLQALTQSAWSTGAGWGLMLTYSVYVKKKEDIAQNCFVVGFGDQTAALLAAMAVIPTIFALLPSPEAAKGVMAGSNTGLTFISLAGLFPRMPGGLAIAPIFFLAMVFAALTSLIAQVEVGIRTLMDFGLNRQKSTLLTTGACFLFGVPSAIVPGFLNNQDWVWGVALLISGFFVLLAMRKYGPERVRQEIINPSADIKMRRWWSLVISYVAPLIFIILTSWWFYVAIASHPKTWWKPFSIETAGTIIFQWLIVLVMLIIANNFLAKKTVRPPEEVES